MRLICGLMHLDGAAASEALLRAMVAQMDVPRLRPRVMLWREGPTGLAVLDFSAGEALADSLPRDGTCTMAADVRLDEPVALACTLGRNASEPQDALLLTGLARFGASGLDRVLGDFAFASYDAEAERLVCGRDLFGIRPLAYVHWPGKLFAFASLPRALYGSGIIAKKIDEDALARRTVLSVRHDDSLIVGIKRLPPAHVIEVSRDNILLKRYWQLDRAAIGKSRCSPEEAAQEMRRLVNNAVRCRLPRSGAIGAHLSGGLDSSAIATLAVRSLRAQGRRLYAYSFLDRQRNDIKLEDETEFIKAVLDQETGIDWTPIRRPRAPPSCIEAVDADNMIPLRAEEPQNAMCAHAEAQGVELILSGWGGDEGATFNGRGALAELLLRGRWQTLMREVSALSRERGWPRWRVLRGEVLSYLWGDLLPARLLDLAKRAVGRPPDLTTLFRLPLSPTARGRLTASTDTPLRMAADGRENRWRLLASPHIAERAETHAQTGARHGFAFAFPLLDRRVVEFALSLPSELFLRDGFRRRPFRDAMADVLPPSVRLRHRKYAPFPSRLIDLAESKDELLARIGAYEKNESIRRLIDLAQLRRQVEAFPSPERVREEMRGGGKPAAGAMMAAAMQALSAAAYLEQYGGE